MARNYSAIKRGLLIVPSALSHSADVSSFLKLLRIMILYRIGNRLRNMRPVNADHCVKLMVRVHGAKIPVQIRLNRGDPYSLVEVLLGDEYTDYLPRGFEIKTVVDLGANIGMFSLLCAAVFPGADLFCVEPDPANSEQLRRNLAGISASSTTALEGAVWTHDGAGTLITSSAATEHSMLEASQNTGSVEIKCYTMESILRLTEVSEIDLLKVDIEGAERELLEHCDTWIERVKVMLLELHPSITGFDIQKLKAKLEPLGFIVFDKRFPVCANSRKLTPGEMASFRKQMDHHC